MTCTFLSDGTITKNQKRCYNNKHDIEFTYVNNGPKLIKEETLALENPITIGDLIKSVFKLPKVSILGTDILQTLFLP